MQNLWFLWELSPISHPSAMLSLDHRLSGYQGSVSSRDPESLCRRPLLVPPSCTSEINNLCLERSRKERLGAVSTCSLCCSCWVPSYGMKAATDNTQTKGLFNSFLHLLPRKIDLWYWKKKRKFEPIEFNACHKPFTLFVSHFPHKT